MEQETRHFLLRFGLFLSFLSPCEPVSINLIKSERVLNHITFSKTVLFRNENSIISNRFLKSYPEISDRINIEGI